MTVILLSKPSLKTQVARMLARTEKGIWYDPSDMSTLFQDSAGTLPVTDVGQPVGLMLDKSKGLVLGSELVVNGTDFVDVSPANGVPDGWTARSATLSVSDGFLVITNTGGDYGNAGQAISTSAGKTYKLTCNFVRGTSSRVYLQVGTVAAGYNLGFATKTTASGTLQVFFRAAGTTSYISAFNGESTPGLANRFDNISVRELPGNHAFNASGNSANFPVLSARYNLLTKTEQFQQSPWAAYNSTIQDNTSDTLDPRGGNNASKAIYAGVAAGFYVDVTMSTSYTYSIYAKKGTYDVAKVAVAYGTPSPSATFNLTSGVASGTDCTATMTSVGNDWWLCKIVFTASGSARIVNYCGTTTGHNLYYFGADLRVANDALNQPAYQRVNTATDYDTVGFKPYLSFNGVNQWLQTNNIDFTYGDKMFVSAGVRKLSDATVTIVAELSVQFYANNGTFAIAAPGTSTPYGYEFNSRGTQNGITNAGYAAPITNVISSIGNISGDQAILRVNGTQVATSTADQGTGNYGNYPLYIGARSGASLWFNGRLYGLVIAGKQASASEIANTEAWLNQKTGAY